MVQGCGAKCAKFFLYVFNIIFWLSGAGILGVGIWLRVDKEAYKVFDLAQEAQGDTLFETACYVLIGIGAFVFLVGFLGCCGALRESRCMLGMYIFFLVVVFAVELAAGILGAIYKDKIEDELQMSLNKTLAEKQIYGEGFAPTTWGATINFVQNQFECCGINGYEDYKDINVTMNLPWPYTCCKLSEGADAENAKRSDVVDWDVCSEPTTGPDYKEGCYMSIKDWIEDHIIILIGVGIGIACLEIIGFLLAVFLCRTIGEE